MPQPARRASGAHLVYAELRRRILDLELRPGQRLYEPELSATLQVSRTPLREALRLLLAEDLIDQLPTGGMAPSTTLPETPYTATILDAAEEGLGERPLLVPALGGSLPIATLTDVLGVPCYGIPFANVDEANHAPDENLDLDWFHRGILASATIQLALGARA